MEIRLDLLAWSFSAGIAAFFNPCGFAMLPAYVAHYLGRNAQEDNAASVQTVLKGISLGAIVSGGFLTTFAILGVAAAPLGSAIGDYIHWAGTIIGGLLVILGILMLLGNTGLSVAAIERLADRISAAGQDDSGTRGLKFYYFYGIAYAVASVGCTLPIFMIVLQSAIQGGFANSVVQFGAYALGMSIMMLGLSVIMVLSKGLIQRAMPVLMQGIRWVGGVIVIGAGGYLVWYNVVYAGLISL
ncbi:MAG: cytochrome c biogenesis CcdA family protein [Candidatus Bipolaricaulia bacterium]